MICEFTFIVMAYLDIFCSEFCSQIFSSSEKCCGDVAII